MAVVFKSRLEAGQQLAEKLKKYKENAIVLAIPRGGVVVGAEIARKLKCPLDVIITRKMGAPNNPELAIGATTSKGGLVLDRELIDRLGVTQAYLHREHLEQIAEARRREKLYLPAVRQGLGGQEPEILGKRAILVDDGIATGATIEAAVNAIKESFPEKIIVAVPVAPSEIVAELRKMVDDLIVLATPDPFFAIGEFYEDFPQVTDEEVISLLQKIDK